MTVLIHSPHSQRESTAHHTLRPTPLKRRQVQISKNHCSTTLPSPSHPQTLPSRTTHTTHTQTPTRTPHPHTLPPSAHPRTASPVPAHACLEPYVSHARAARGSKRDALQESVTWDYAYNCATHSLTHISLHTQSLHIPLSIPMYTLFASYAYHHSRRRADVPTQPLPLDTFHHIVERYDGIK